MATAVPKWLPAEAPWGTSSPSGAPEGTSNTKTLPDGTSDTRVSKFDYHWPTGLLKYEEIEPFQPDLWLRTDYEYDVFGNTHGPDESTIIEALPRRLRDRGVDAVVSGMGC